MSVMPTKEWFEQCIRPGHEMYLEFCKKNLSHGLDVTESMRKAHDDMREHHDKEMAKQYQEWKKRQKESRK